MLNWEKFSMIITALEKTFTISCSLNKMKQQHRYQKNFHIGTVLRRTLALFLQSFSIDDQEKFDFLAFKNSKYLFYRFNDFIKAYGNPRYKLLHTKKLLDIVRLQKVEQKNNQFLLEKIIHGIEFENLYVTDSERKPEIMCMI